MHKLYFLMCGRLLGNEEAEQIAAHPLRGSLFETFIISELMKSRFNQGGRPDFFSGGTATAMKSM